MKFPLNITETDYNIFILKNSVYDGQSIIDPIEYFKLQRYIYKNFFYMRQYERAHLPRHDWKLFY